METKHKTKSRKLIKVLLLLALAIVLTWLSFKDGFFTIDAYNLPSGNLDYVTVDILQYDSYYSNDLEDVYYGKFWSDSEQEFIELSSFWTYLDNAESTSRMYIIPNDIFNNWMYWEGGVNYTTSTDNKLHYILFQYDSDGASSSYMRLFDQNGVNFFSRSLNNLSSSSWFYNSVSKTGNTEYWVGWTAGKIIGEGLGYDAGYAVGYDDAMHVYGQFINGQWQSYSSGYIAGQESIDTEQIAEDAYDSGYLAGLNAGQANNFMTFEYLLGGLFGTVGAIMSIELLPNLTIGAIIMVPLVLGILSFIVGVATISISNNRSIAGKPSKVPKGGKRK